MTEQHKISLELEKQTKNSNVRAFELIQNITDGRPIASINIETKPTPIIIDDT